MSSMYLLFIHCIQPMCNNLSNGCATHGNNNYNGNNDGNRNGNGDSDGNGDGGCDYKASIDAIATYVGISLVVIETAMVVAVILMTVVVDCQE